MQLSLVWRRVCLLLLLLAVPLFFVGGPSAYSLEVYRRLWDLGHPAFFAIFSILLISYGVIKRWRHFIIGFLLVFLLSLAIEKLQTYVGRSASWWDVLFNLCGFLMGGIFLATNVTHKILFSIVIIAGLLPGLWKVFKSLMLCWTLWQQFPVLLSDESQWEKYAWGSQIKLQKHSVEPGYLLQFNGKAYASADMMGFMQSWRPYKKLVLEVNSVSTESFILTLRLSDKQHQMSSQKYNDRFNRQLLLQPGKQIIEINLLEVENAPVNRKMTLDQIYLLKLFLPKDGNPQKLYLTKIYLE